MKKAVSAVFEMRACRNGCAFVRSRCRARRRRCSSFPAARDRPKQRPERLHVTQIHPAAIRENSANRLDVGGRRVPDRTKHGRKHRGFPNARSDGGQRGRRGARLPRRRDAGDREEDFAPQSVATSNSKYYGAVDRMGCVEGRLKKLHEFPREIMTLILQISKQRVVAIFPL
jgi:hypothetical protein